MRLMRNEVTTPLSSTMATALRTLAARDGWQSRYQLRRSTIDALTRRGLVEQGEPTPIKVRRSSLFGPVDVTEYDRTIRLTAAGRDAAGRTN